MRVRFRSWDKVMEGVVENVGKEKFTIRLATGSAELQRKWAFIDSSAGCAFDKDETAEQRAANLAGARKPKSRPGTLGRRRRGDPSYA